MDEKERYLIVYLFLDKLLLLFKGPKKTGDKKKIGKGKLYHQARKATIDCFFSI